MGRCFDDDVVMTQQTMTSFRCPVLFSNMTPTGEHRPVKPKPGTGHTPRCCFSHKGIMEQLKKTRGSCVCPIAGCNAKVNKADLVDDKEMARAIREKEQEDEE